MRIRHALVVGIAGALAVWACSNNDTLTGVGPGQGLLSVKIKDHPLWFDSVASVNVFVVRVDARIAESDSAEAEVARDDSTGDIEREHEHEHGDSLGEHHFGDHEWRTIATPDTTFDLLALQNGVTALLGDAVVDTGTFRALRLVIDPSRSNIVLKDGTILSGDASPFGRFSRGERSGIKIVLDHDIRVTEGGKTIVILDFNLEDSFHMRGDHIRSGLSFSPSVHGSRENR